MHGTALASHIVTTEKVINAVKMAQKKENL
jgi:hypothetical protein